jgi:integrase
MYVVCQDLICRLRGMGRQGIKPDSFGDISVREYTDADPAKRWRGLVLVVDLDGAQYQIKRLRATKGAAATATRLAAEGKLAHLRYRREAAAEAAAQLEAEAALAEQLANLGDLTTTVGDLVRHVMASPEVRKLSPGTIANYTSACKPILASKVATLRPRELDVAGVRDYLEAHANGHGRTSAQMAQAVLNRAMNRAVESRAMMTPFNPVSAARRAVPNVTVRPSRIDHKTTPDEATVDAMLAALRDDPYFGAMMNPRRKSAHGKPGTAEPNPLDVADIMTLMYWTGTRVGEASALRWGDLHFGESAYAEITGTAQFVSRAAAQAAGLNEHGTIRLERTKTAKSHRLVPLISDVATQLQQRAALMGVDLADPAHLMLPVFPSRQRRDRFRDASDLRKAIKEAQGKHGINHAATHVARKAYITRMSDAGVPDSKISDAVGHVRIAQTQSYIGRGRQMDADVREAMERAAARAATTGRPGTVGGTNPTEVARG